MDDVDIDGIDPASTLTDVDVDKVDLLLSVVVALLLGVYTGTFGILGICLSIVSELDDGVEHFFVFILSRSGTSDLPRVSILFFSLEFSPIFAHISLIFEPVVLEPIFAQISFRLVPLALTSCLRIDTCFIKDIGIASGHGGPVEHAPDVGFDIAVAVIVAVVITVVTF